MPSSGGEAVQVTRRGGRVAFESPDGKSIYYSKTDRASGLWKAPAQGGEETQVLGSLVPRAFAVQREGIYFISAPVSDSDYLIQFLDSATGKIRTIVAIGKAPPSGLTVSQDGQWCLYPQLDEEGSDLMLVEDFH